MILIIYNFTGLNLNRTIILKKQTEPSICPHRPTLDTLKGSYEQDIFPDIKY